MKKARCLGLVGGLGVGASVHSYQSLAKAHEARGRTLDLVMAHAETSQQDALASPGDAEEAMRRSVMTAVAQPDGGCAQYLSRKNAAAHRNPKEPM